MCGICGYIAKNGQIPDTSQSLESMNRRGPDGQRGFKHGKVFLGHARLSIIDTSLAAFQPMSDESNRYTIVFNGEIYNFKELREDLLQRGVKFSNDSDTEVLLYLYILDGEACLQKLIGFFGFAVYDSWENKTFIARDRMGIKPMFVYEDENCIAFASEMKTLMALGIRKELDYVSLHQFLQLNYIPGPSTILKGVRKLLPGHQLRISRESVCEESAWYSVPFNRLDTKSSPLSYDDAKTRLRNLVESAVEMRLVADVPLGAFLSGGIDSSVIVSQASKHKKDLHTFSIGFADEPYFDETYYANLVAKKYNTNHTVFSLKNEDMYSRLFSILDYLDEPFADSSAIAVYILCEYTRKSMTVALSGDGGDELFAGYNKHQAELRSRSNSIVNMMIKLGAPIWKMFPQGRNSGLLNKFRQVNRYAEGLQMSPANRYWRWCSFISAEEASSLLRVFSDENDTESKRRRSQLLSDITPNGPLDEILLADVHLVLPNDMLTKVDMMSMANSLEVRVPLLDHRIVEFAFGLPTNYKIEKGNGKKILKDAFREELPEELFSRPKHGFEVPLLNWFKTGLRTLIEQDLLADDFIEAQGIFSPDKIKAIKQKLFSSNPGDTHAQVWGLIVFQYWWKKYFNTNA